MKNKHGLSRYSKADVRLQVRKSCGFGCVVCGASIYEYHHADVPFAEAEEHDPQKITHLCIQCHGRLTRKFLSPETVEEARRNPFCKRRGYANEFLDIGRAHPKVVFGGVTLTNCPIPIEVRGIPLFQVKKPEGVGGPFRLSATFHNSRGRLSLKIIDNEWRAFETNWDVEAVGVVVTIRDSPGHISLRMATAPPDGVTVERLDMFLAGYHFVGSSHELTVVYPNGVQNNFTRCLFDHNYIGLSLD